MAEKYRWTVDVDGGDFGGRSQDNQGIHFGLPLILQTFQQNNIKAVFFISTELLKAHKNEIKKIRDAGHELGSHGHFHINMDSWRREDDRDISNTLLSMITGTHYNLYRAPKFKHILKEQLYSNPANHVGLLKYVWFGGKITRDTIFYMHPFDLVDNHNAPNLFCKLWYSRSREASKTFQELASMYPGEKRLN